MHRTTQNIHKTTQNILELCGPCPVFASYTLAFALQLRKKAQKNLSQGNLLRFVQGRNPVSYM